MLHSKLVSALEKVFLDKEPASLQYTPEGFRNETISFQVAYMQPAESSGFGTFVNCSVSSDIPAHVRVRRVVNVPVGMATYPDADDDYLRKTPGLYPDLLIDVSQCRLRALPGQWNSLWIDVEGAPAGEHVIDISLQLEGDPEHVSDRHVTVKVLDAELPEQKLIHTRWLHCDAIAQYYHTDMWSEDFWRYLEKFIAGAARRGINSILTPIHTPPLDTAVGGERMTSQLVDVYLTNGKYSFGFDRLHRFVAICERSGVKYFEMAHLFTQWGAKCSPKIIANVDGTEKKIFGWDVSATSPEYRDFLSAYLPALKSELRALGILDRTIWHISDEPHIDHAESYRAAKAQVLPFIGDQYILDALSNVDFYKTGIVDHPVPGNNHVHDFIDAKVKGLWTYYCCGQYKYVSNQFIAMPAQRTRILGLQMYKYDIVGFLQWGYNFYASQYSYYPVDPYGTTDGDGFVPGGDTYQVYPGKDGEPLDSIRIMVFAQGLQDMRALQLLESLTSRAHVLELIDNSWVKDITFSDYPRDGAYLPALRAKVDAEIMEALKN